MQIDRLILTIVLPTVLTACGGSSSLDYSSIRDSIAILASAITGREPVLSTDADMARKVAPAVVRISVDTVVKLPNDVEVTINSGGTGWAIAGDLIVTAQHVVEDAYSALQNNACTKKLTNGKCAQVLVYTFDGRTIEANIEKTNDKATIRVATQNPPAPPPYDLDMALLRLPANSMSQKLAIATDNTVKDNHVIAIGNPGLMVVRTGGWSVTVGRPAVVCPTIDGQAIEINGLKGPDAERYFAIDADSGNSGGPIVDSAGYVVAMLAGSSVNRSRTACTTAEAKIAPSVVLTLLGTANASAHGGPSAMAMRAQIAKWAPSGFAGYTTPDQYVKAAWAEGDDIFTNELSRSEMTQLESVLTKTRSSTLQVLQDYDCDGPMAPIGMASAVLIGPGRALTANHVGQALLALPPTACGRLQNMAGESIKITGIALAGATDQMNGIDLALFTFDDADGKKMSQSQVTSVATNDPGTKDVVMTVGHPGITSGGLGAFLATAGRHLGWGVKSTDTADLVDNTNQFASTVPALPGNSGGPVFNSNGELIGIISNGQMPAEMPTKPSFLKIRQFLPALIDSDRKGFVTQMVARIPIQNFVLNPPAPTDVGSPIAMGPTGP
jgi:S1-C subfamily serine protease